MGELAEALDDDRRRAHAAWRLSALAQRIADYAAMETTARQAVECARRAGDDEIRLLAQRMLAMSLDFQDRPGEGRSLAEEGAGRSALRWALRRVEGLYLNALSVMLAMQSDDVGALLVDQQSLVAYRAAGDRRNEAIAQGNIGAGWLGLGDLARARRRAGRGSAPDAHQRRASPGGQPAVRSVNARAMARRRCPCARACARGFGHCCRGSRARPGGRSLVPGGRGRAGTRALHTGGGCLRSCSCARQRNCQPVSARRFGRAGQGRVGARRYRGCYDRRWSHCWRSAQGPATMKRRSKAWNSRAWSNGRVTECWQRSATLAPPSGWSARTRRLGRRRRRSSTPSFAKVSFATSRLTVRSQRRGNAQRGQYHVSTHTLKTDRLFDARFRAAHAETSPDPLAVFPNFWKPG